MWVLACSGSWVAARVLIEFSLGHDVVQARVTLPFVKLRTGPSTMLRTGLARKGKGYGQYIPGGGEEVRALVALRRRFQMHIKGLQILDIDYIIFIPKYIT